MRIGRQKSVMDKAAEYVQSAADTVIPQIESALETAREKAGPTVAVRGDRGRPRLVDAREMASPDLDAASLAPAALVDVAVTAGLAALAGGLVMAFIMERKILR